MLRRYALPCTLQQATGSGGHDASSTNRTQPQSDMPKKSIQLAEHKIIQSWKVGSSRACRELQRAKFMCVGTVQLSM